MPFFPQMRTAIAPKGGEGHFEQTIGRCIDIKDYSDCVSVEQLQVILSMYPSGKVKVWGFTPGLNNYNFRKGILKLQAGDHIRFYGRRTFSHDGVITHYLRNAELADRLWGKKVASDKATLLSYEFIAIVDDVVVNGAPSDRIYYGVQVVEN